MKTTKTGPGPAKTMSELSEQVGNILEKMDEPDYKELYLAMKERLNVRADGARTCIHMIKALRGFVTGHHSPIVLLLGALEQMSLHSPLLTTEDRR
jgi:hypothetical protein